MLLAQRLGHSTRGCFDVSGCDRTNMVAGHPPHRNLSAKPVPTKIVGHIEPGPLRIRRAEQSYASGVVCRPTAPYHRLAVEKLVRDGPEPGARFAQVQ